MSIILKVISMIYPPKCIFCNNVVPIGEIYCKTCANAVNHINDTTECMKSGIYFTRLISAVVYDMNFRIPIKKMKKKSTKDVTKYVGDMLFDVIKKEFNDLNFDFVTTIPMSNKKFKEIGFNHSEVLSQYISEKMGLPHLPYIMKKLDSGKIQHELNAKERKLNAEKSYIIGDDKIDLKDKVILLIDDVATTGSTLEACSKILIDNGANAVYCATVAATVYKLDKN